MISSKQTIFILTLDDVLLRDEWSDIPLISFKELGVDADLEVLDLCLDLGIKATLFIPAIVAKKFSRTVKNLSRNNFEIAAHGYRHETLRKFPFDAQKSLINLSKKTIEETIGREVTGWRSPGLYFDHNTLMAVEKSNISWCSNVLLPSWLKRFPFVGYGEKVEIPISSSTDYEMLVVGFTVDKILKHCFDHFERINKRESNEVVTLVIHPWIYAGSRKNMSALKAFLQILVSMNDVCCLRCSDILEYIPYLRAHPFYEAFLRLTTRARAVLAKRDYLWRLVQSIYFWRLGQSI